MDMKLRKSCSFFFTTQNTHFYFNKEYLIARIWDALYLIHVDAMK